jgi:hypothetical protein
MINVQITLFSFLIIKLEMFHSCNLIWSWMKSRSLNLVSTVQFSLFLLVVSRSEHLCSPLRPIFFVGGVWVFPYSFFLPPSRPSSVLAEEFLRSDRLFFCTEDFSALHFSACSSFPTREAQARGKSIDSRRLSFLWRPFFFSGLRFSSSWFLAARPLFLLVFLSALTSSSVFLSSWCCRSPFSTARVFLLVEDSHAQSASCCRQPGHCPRFVFPFKSWYRRSHRLILSASYSGLRCAHLVVLCLPLSVLHWWCSSSVASSPFLLAVAVLTWDWVGLRFEILWFPVKILVSGSLQPLVLRLVFLSFCYVFTVVSWSHL